MCGRFSLATAADELVEVFEVPPLAFGVAPRYNIAPGQDALVVARDRRGRRMGPMLWGLVPARSREGGNGFINARGETVGETPSFRDAFLRRRCLVPADGFYEWRRDGGGKIPFWFGPAAGGVLALAGIWERWAAPGHEPRVGFAIVTVEAGEDVRGVHDRMPLLLEGAARETWLDDSAPLDRVRRFIAPAPAGTLVRRRVSTRVNSPATDGPALVEAVAEDG